MATQYHIVHYFLRAILSISFSSSVLSCIASVTKAEEVVRLFPIDAASHEWVEFEAAGFDQVVTGVIYRQGDATNGLPLSSIGTGYLDVDIDATLGQCTLFNTFVRPRELGGIPFLGIAVDGRTTVLTTKPMDGVDTARRIHYWGHYPVADLEFELAGPVQVGLRAYSPFLPGDTTASNTPGTVFELHLRNTEATRHKVTVALSFPGPSEKEVGAVNPYRNHAGQEMPSTVSFTREKIGPQTNPANGQSRLSGVHFTSRCPRGGFWRGDLVTGYALGIIGEEKLRDGGPLAADADAWRQIATRLPQADKTEPGTSIAADLILEPDETRVLRFVLAWYAPRWVAQQYNGEWLSGNRSFYVHKYAERYKDAREVAEFLEREHQQILYRILAWQQVIYTENRLPGWLQDSLINILHLLGQNSFWDVSAAGVNKPGHWLGQDGVFCINESLVSCASPAVMPCEWLGNAPVNYFFPDLARLTTKAHAYYQRANGQVPVWLGIGTVLEWPSYDIEAATNGSAFVQLVDRLWQRSRDDQVLEELYPSVKAAIQFTAGELDIDGDGLPDCDDTNYSSHFFDCFQWHGTVAPVASLWLGALRVGERMAQSVGDDAFARDCRTWYAKGRASLEERLWNEEAGSYLLYNRPSTGDRSAIVSADQLLGQWVAYYHGTEPIYPKARLAQVLDTMRRLNVDLIPCGLLCGINPDGSISNENDLYYAMHPAGSVNMAAALMIYHDDAELRKTGLEAVRRTWKTMVIDHGLAWKMPVMVDLDKETNETKPIHQDYYHNSSLWVIPPAILGQDVRRFCAPGGFVHRILQASLKPEP